jgi:hypothetical protein
VSDYDGPWKEALDVYFEAFLAFFFPPAHADVDWSRGYESLDKELQQVAPEAESGRQVVDKLVKVWLRDGRETWVLIHVEVQSQVDADFAERMYVYNYRLYDRYNRRVASLAVLGDDRAGWRPDRFGYHLWGCTIDFRFPAVKLLDYAADEAALEAHPNPFATVVMAHLKTQETHREPHARRAWKWRLVRGLHERGLSTRDVRQLLRFIDWMMDLPRELADPFWQDLQQYQEAQRMPYVSTEQLVYESRGLEQGIEALLEVRFGADGLKLMEEVRRIQTLDKLQAVLRAAKTAASPDELRRLWSE